MSVHLAVTSDELTALAGPSLPRWFAVYDTSDTVLATGQVDAPGGLFYPLTALNIKNNSAGFGTATAVNDLTVLIGSTAGGFDRGIYRRRRDALGDDTLLPISAIGENDPGRINIGLRSTSIQDNDYVTVLDRFDPFGVFPHIDYAGVGVDASIYEDWGELTATQFNRYPPPIVNLTIDGQDGHYATHVYSGTSKTFTITFTIILWPTSSSASWIITLPSGWTLNSGSLTGSGTPAGGTNYVTGSINVTAPHSASTYTLHFRAQEDNGSATDAARKVWITSFTYPPLRIVRIDNRNDSQLGSRRTITFNKLPVVPPGAMWHLFDMDPTPIPTASRSFSGWMKGRREITATGTTNVTLDLIGPSLMLDLIGGQSQIMYATAGNVSTWQDLYSSLSYLDFVIWWILSRRTAGFLQLFNYTPFGLTNTQKRMSGWQIDAGTVLQQIKAQTRRYLGANFGCNPTGEFMLQVHPSRMPWADRGSIPVRASLTARQYTGADLGYEEPPNLRHLRTECFVSDASTDTPVWADAPTIPGQGAREDKQDRLICDSADELYEGTGNEYTAQNNPYSNGTIKLRNWPVFYPAEMSRMGLDIAPALHFNGQAYDGYVIVKEVDYAHNPDGTIETTLQVEAETVGVPGVDAPIPSPDTGLNGATQSPSNYYQRTPFIYVPLTRSTNPNPKGTSKGVSVLPRDGSIALCGIDSHAYFVSNALRSPIYKDITPSDLGSFIIQHGMLRIGGQEAWLLGYDGTNSATWYTPNFAQTPRPTWTKGGLRSGLYDLVRLTDTPSNLYIYSPAAASGSATINDGLTSGLGPNTHLISASYPFGMWETTVGGTYISTGGRTGGGRIQGQNTASPHGGLIKNDASVVIDLGAEYTVTAASHYHISTTNNVPYSARIQYFDALGSHVTGGVVNTANSSTSWRQLTTSTPVSGVRYVVFGAEQNAFQGPCYVDDLSVTYNTPSGVATVSYSSDRGLTWSSIALSSSPGLLGGFDQQYGGNVTFAAIHDKTQKASSFGGSYADDQSLSANPILIETPWGTRNSTSANNTGASHEYIYGLDAPVAGATLFWVVGGTPVNITPVIGGYPGIPVGPNCLTSYLGKCLAYLGSFNGVIHLVTSVDAGASWIDRGALNAAYIRVRRKASVVGQLFAVGSANVYSPDFGVTLVSRAKPSVNSLVFWEAYY